MATSMRLAPVHTVSVVGAVIRIAGLWPPLATIPSAPVMAATAAAVLIVSPLRDATPHHYARDSSQPACLRAEPADHPSSAARGTARLSRVAAPERTRQVRGDRPDRG